MTTLQYPLDNLPVGAIIVWTDPQGRLPGTQWAVCSGGGNYTNIFGETVPIPNLSDHFVRGTNDHTLVNTTTGVATQALAVSGTTASNTGGVPHHTHALHDPGHGHILGNNPASDGALDYVGTTITVLNGSILSSPGGPAPSGSVGFIGSGGGGNPVRQWVGDGGSINNIPTTESLALGLNVNDPNPGNDGQHTHTFSAANININTIPPYIALYYIIKISPSS